MHVTETDRLTCSRDAASSHKYRFNIGKKSFTQQFAKLYETRLKCMTEPLHNSIKTAWGKY